MAERYRANQRIALAAFLTSVVIIAAADLAHAGRISNRCYAEMKGPTPSESGLAVCRQATQASWEGTSDRGRSYVNLSWGLAKLARWPESLEAAEAAIKLRPNYPNAFVSLSRALANLGRINEAIEAARDAVRHGPGYGWGHVMLALTLGESGQPEKMREAANRGRDRVSNVAVQRYLKAIGSTLSSKGAGGNLAQAESDAKTAIRRFPSDSATHVLLGYVMYRKGKFQEAADIVEKAIGMGAETPGRRILLASVYRKLGRNDDAEEALKLALTLDPVPEVAAEIKGMLPVDAIVAQPVQKKSPKTAQSATIEVNDPPTLKRPVFNAKRNKRAVAVIIGNKDYQKSIPDVDFAHNDAGAFKTFVVDALGYDPNNIIDLRDATQAELLAAFGNRETHEGKLWRYLDARGRSDIIVFYSGHGVPSLKDRRGYLLPVNADPDSPEINGYPLDTLLGNLGKLKARSISVFLDACFSGESQKGMLVRATSGITITPTLPDNSTKMTIITAAQSDQVASWDYKARHGMFTRHLLDALYGEADQNEYGNGDGKVAVAEIREYLDDHMTQAARREFGRHQNSWVQGDDGTVLVTIPTN